MISVCAIVRDEENFIRGMIDNCLPYLKDGDELVIVDGGSTDKTVEIIEKEYGDYDNLKLYQTKQRFKKRRWIREDEARNAAWLKCSNDWILSLDADEAYSPEFYQNIRHIIEVNKDAYAFYFPTINFIESTTKICDLESWTDYHIRLAHRGHFIWVGNIHSSLWLEGRTPIEPNHPQAKALDYFLYHYARVKKNLIREYGEIPRHKIVEFNGYHPRGEFDD